MWGLIEVPSRSVTAASSGLLRGLPLHSWPASHLHLHDVGNMAATSDADAASKTCAPHGRDEPFYPPAYVVQPFHYGMYLPPSNIIANHRLIVNSSHMTQRVMNLTFFYVLTSTI